MSLVSKRVSQRVNRRRRRVIWLRRALYTIALAAAGVGIISLWQYALTGNIPWVSDGFALTCAVIVTIGTCLFGSEQLAREEEP